MNYPIYNKFIELVSQYDPQKYVEMLNTVNEKLHNYIKITKPNMQQIINMYHDIILFDCSNATHFFLITICLKIHETYTKVLKESTDLSILKDHPNLSAVEYLIIQSCFDKLINTKQDYSEIKRLKTEILDTKKKLMNVINSYVILEETEIFIMPSIDLLEFCKKIIRNTLKNKEQINSNILFDNKLIFFMDYIEITNDVSLFTTLFSYLVKQCLTYNTLYNKPCRIIGKVFEDKNIDDKNIAKFDKLFDKYCETNVKLFGMYGMGNFIGEMSKLMDSILNLKK